MVGQSAMVLWRFCVHLRTQLAEEHSKTPLDGVLLLNRQGWYLLFVYLNAFVAASEHYVGSTHGK